MAASRFSAAFPEVERATGRWFPGHMHSGLQQMARTLRDVDCVLEVLDARAPISCWRAGARARSQLGLAHPSAPARPTLLLLNKRELAAPALEPRVRAALAACAPARTPLLFLSAKAEGAGWAHRVARAVSQLAGAGDKPRSALVIGVPNTGKSSVINALRSRCGAGAGSLREGAMPGVTRAVHTRVLVHRSPPLYLVDAPGVLEPAAAGGECALRLALCGAVPAHLVGEQLLAEYLLWWACERAVPATVAALNFELGLDAAGAGGGWRLQAGMGRAEARRALAESAARRHQRVMVRAVEGAGAGGGLSARLQLDACARRLLHALRDGRLPRLTLDDDLL